MPRGTPLTPEQIGRAAEVYARTGSYSDAARAVGAPDPSTVRKALLRVGDPNRSQLHARAIARGLARGRRVLDDVVREVRERTRTVDLRAALTLEDLLAAAKTTSYGVSRLVDLAELELKRRAATLTRRKLRAEARALERDTTPTIDQVLATLASMPEPELRAAVARLREARASQPATPATSAAPAT